MDDDALQQSLRDLYEHAPCGYIFASTDGTLLRVNETFIRWMGYSRTDLLNRHFQDLLTVAGKIFYENQYSPLLRMQGTVEEVTFDFLCEDGNRLPVLLNSVLRTGTDGSSNLVASTVFRAVDRRAYERELLVERSRVQHLADVVSASIDAIMTCWIDGRVQSWNNSAERLFGYSSESLAALRLNNILPFGGEAGYTRTLETLRQDKPFRGETVALCASGESVDVSVSVTPHLDDLGAVDSFSVIVGDISERRDVERLQQEFLAMASHELRTPLAIIHGYAQLMERRRQYSENGIASILAQTNQLATLVDDLLLASQMEADRFLLHLTEVNLIDIAGAAVGQVLYDGADITVRGPRHPVLIRADQERLMQVFSNLLTNAVKYSPDGGDIEVDISENGNDICVEVIDHGMGVPADSIPRLFDRFYRAPQAIAASKGAGLGLYITRRIVEGHGGTIRVASEVGKGSRFRITFPSLTRANETAVG